MRIVLRVDYANGEGVDVLCNAADLVAFEEKYSRSVARLEKEMRLTDLLFIAWHSLHRRKQTELDFVTWLNDIDSVSESSIDPKSLA